MGRINFIHSQKKIKNAWQADCYVKGKRIRRCYPTREEAEKALEQLEQGIIPPADYKGPKAEIPVRLLRPYFEEWKGDRSIWTEGNKSLPDGVSLVTVQLIMRHEDAKIGVRAADNFLCSIGAPEAWHLDEELAAYYC